MGNYLSLPILALIAVIQSTFTPQIRLLGGGPDLVFLFVLTWSLNAPLEGGVVWALVGGILQDLLSAAATGTSAVGMILTVFIANQLSSQFNRVGLIVIAGLVLAGTLIQQFSISIILFFSGAQIDLSSDFSYIILPTVAYNLALVWPIYWLVRRIQRRFVGGPPFFS